MGPLFSSNLSRDKIPIVFPLIPAYVIPSTCIYFHHDIKPWQAF
ncbi:hypothetical protein DSUL_50451 [Desulfovibrionales bacterium]